MRYTNHAIFFGDAPQHNHDELLVVGSNVGILINRRNFVLPGRYFIVAGFYGHTQFVQFALGFHHAGQHAFRDGAKVMIIKFLAFGWCCTKQGTACRHQVRACQVKVAVDEEVFLLGASGGGNQATISIAKQFQDALRLRVERFHGAQQRGLFIQRFACPGNESGGDAQGGAIGVF